MNDDGYPFAIEVLTCRESTSWPITDYIRQWSKTETKFEKFVKAIRKK